MKYGVTTGLTWDFTVNTDFSQVEADEQQVNLTRFSLFFPEKRDFFLENSGIFQFGGGFGGFAKPGAAAAAAAGPRPGRTRRRTCGCSSAAASACRRTAVSIPILAGTRLTGRAGRFSVGALNIQQRELDRSRVGPRRARHQLHGAARCGATSWRTRTSASCARTRRRAARTTTAPPAPMRTSGSGSATSTATWRRRFSPQSVAAGGGTRLRDAGRAPAIRTAQWTIRGAIRQHRRALQRRDGVRAAHGRQQFVACSPRGAFRPQWMSKWIRETRPHWQFDKFTRQNGDGLESRYQDCHLAAHLSRQLVHRGRRQPERRGIRQPFTINTRRGVQREPGPLRVQRVLHASGTRTARPRLAQQPLLDRRRSTTATGAATRWGRRSG